MSPAILCGPVFVCFKGFGIIGPHAKNQQRSYILGHQESISFDFVRCRLKRSTSSGWLGNGGDQSNFLSLNFSTHCINASIEIPGPLNNSKKPCSVLAQCSSHDARRTSTVTTL